MVSFKKTQDENILENPLFDEKIEYCANQNEESILRQLSLVSYVLRDSSIITKQSFDLIIANKSLCLKKRNDRSFSRFLDKNTRTLRASNMHQINSFVKIVFAQLKSFEEVNEWKYENQSQAVNERARQVMTNLIFEISFEMVWNSSGNIKSIQEDTTKILSERSTKDDQASKRMMTEYQEKIKAIPDWGETKAKNIFFRNQSVDAKFELTSQVPRELTDFFPPQYSESLSLEKIIDNESF
jgi:hypothetical protein